MKHVAVWCGSSLGTRPSYVEAAMNLGRELAEREIGLVYGGAARGLMGVLADATLEAGGEVFGVIPQGLVDLEVAHTGLTRQVIVSTLEERKAIMIGESDAFVALPGGHGTLDELFEVLTWTQLGVHDKAMGLLDVEDYYEHLVAHLDRCRDEGFLAAQYRSMLLHDTRAGALLDQLASFTPPARPAWNAAKS
tara:strand:+ start:8555 stop:9133 length:579 start_codon:yes stop_codon:yes gene_type:complete